MPAPLRGARLCPTPGPASVSCSSFSFRLAPAVDLELVFWAPLEENRPALGVERLGRGGLEVLPDDLQLPAAVELDDVAGHHPGVDDVPDAAGLGVRAGLCSRSGFGHADLLGTDGEAPAAALDHVRDADEPRHERVRRVLVHLGRRADLLDPAAVE